MTPGMPKALALLGGTPQFAQPLHVGRPSVGDPSRLMRRLEGVLERSWFTNHGPLVQEFEQRVADLLGVRHCVAVANATLGLELTVESLQISGEVIVPAFTFVATVAALVRRGVRPVFCDVDPVTHQMDPAAVEALITERTSAILAVHLWGTPGPVTALQAIADRHRLRLIFDAAHAFASQHPAGMVGGFGTAEVFSFHATKFIQSAEGGAVTTNCDELAQELRLLRNFGFAGLDRVDRVGTNAKMSELHAAVGLTSLESLPRLLEINREHYAAYGEVLARLDGLSLYAIPEDWQHNRQYIVVQVDPERFPLTRDELVAVLWSENVRARRYFTPGCHRIEAFAPYIESGRALPWTDRLSAELLQLPTGASVSREEIHQIGQLLWRARDESDALRRCLNRPEHSAC